jgi:hypothetical protein
MKSVIRPLRRAFPHRSLQEHSKLISPINKQDPFLRRGVDEISIILPDLHEGGLKAEILQVGDQVAEDVVGEILSLKKIIIWLGCPRDVSYCRS